MTGFTLDILNKLKELSSFDENDYNFHDDIPCSSLKSWDEFHSVIPNLLLEKNEVLFRGQSNAEWGLIPSLNRINNEPSKQVKDDLLNRFRTTLNEMGFVQKSQLDSNNLWALGRHYGLPTPLLDWTLNPYIALFFSFLSSSDTTGFPTIYIINQRLFEQNITDAIFFNTNNHENERELAQLSRYSLTNKVDNLENLIKKDKENSPFYFRKLIFKEWQTKDLKKFLETLGITYKQLYPNSIQGAVEFCNSFIPYRQLLSGTLAKFEQRVV